MRGVLNHGYHKRCLYQKCHHNGLQNPAVYHERIYYKHCSKGHLEWYEFLHGVKRCLDELPDLCKLNTIGVLSSSTDLFHK